MTSAVNLAFLLLFILNAGCTTLRDYKTSHNQFLEDTRKKLNQPDTKEQIKTMYFTVTPDPYQSGLLIDSLGNSAFEYGQCKIKKFNDRYPSNYSGNLHRNPRCIDGGDK